MRAMIGARVATVLVYTVLTKVVGGIVVVGAAAGQTVEDCTDGQLQLAAEYQEYAVTARDVMCSDIKSSGTSKNFTWEQLVGGSRMRGVENGDHWPWGLMSTTTVEGLDAVYDTFYKAFTRRLVVNSGYRCPRGNAAVNGDAESPHILGDSVDIDVEGLGTEVMMEEEHKIIYNAVWRSGGTVSDKYKYSTSLSHIHATWTVPAGSR